MKRIGLTGNIGTGKSTVARIFEILGIPVYHADFQAKLLLDTDEVKEQILLIFGTHVFNTSNQIDRKTLADIVFSDKAKLEQLNNIIHPLVEKDFSIWCNNHLDKDYIIHEAAILFESGFDRLFDATILVMAPESLCIERVIKRDLLSEQLVLNRMNNQWNQEKKREKANYIVMNDENTMLIPQILDIHNRIINS